MLGNDNFSKDRDNNQKKKYDQPLYVPEYKSSSPNGLDPSVLSYSYIGGYLQVTITPLVFENPNDISKYNYDNDNAVSIRLSPSKARIFYTEITNLLANMDTINNVGVQTTTGGLIIFSSGKEFGTENKVLIIRKFDENGNIIATYGHEFVPNPNLYSCRNYDQNTKEFERVDFGNSDVDNLLCILKSFSEAMCASQAYANIYYGRFESSKIHTKLNLIMDKLGVERSSEYKKMGRGTTNSYFNPANNSPSADDNGGVQVNSKYSSLLDDDYE